MAHPPRKGALVQPAPIRARPVHFDIPNRVQNIKEPGKQALEVLAVRLIGGQGRLKGSFRLRDETVTVDLQSLFRSLCAHILLLHFRKHALRFSVQLLPCALLVLFRLGQCRALAPRFGKRTLKLAM